MNVFFKKIFLFCFVVFLTNHLVDYWFSYPNKIYENALIEKKQMKWNSIKEEKYEKIILGTSKAYNAYNPNVLDSFFVGKTYNMATGSQHISESFFILKEILNYQQPKLIILDLYSTSFNKPDWYHILKNEKYFSKKNKLLLYSYYPEEILINKLLPLNYLKSYLRKNSLKQRFAFDSSDLINNWSKGWERKDTLNTYVNMKKIKLNTYDYNSNLFNSNLYFLNKINKICLENNIDLICVRAPFPNSRFELSNKDEENEFWTKKLKEMEIYFYDFNYSSDNYYPDSYFSDNTHMNFIGSNVVTNELVKLLKSRTRNEHSKK